MELENGVPCSHPGCLHHVTHPCERCGRIGGMKRKIAPWKDYKGNVICEGDTIVHPSGEKGVVWFAEYNESGTPSDQWVVDYGRKPHSRLCLQIGDKGQAVVSR